MFIVSCSFRLQNFLYFPCHRLYHLLFATPINRTFLLFLRHENPSICILGVYHAVMVVVVMSVVVAMLDCSVDTHHCSVDTSELLHAYFCCLSRASSLEKSISHSEQVADIIVSFQKTLLWRSIMKWLSMLIYIIFIFSSDHRLDCQYHRLEYTAYRRIERVQVYWWWYYITDDRRILFVITLIYGVYICIVLSKRHYL